MSGPRSWREAALAPARQPEMGWGLPRELVEGIEAEAAQAERERIRAAVEGLPDPTADRDIVEVPLVSRAAVLQAISDSAKDPEGGAA